MTKTQEQVKLYLSEIEFLKRKLESVKDDLAELIELKVRISSPLLSPVRAGKSGSPVENSVIRYFEKEKKLTKAIDRLEAKIDVYRNKINCIKDTSTHKIIYERYVNLKTWSKICEEMNYSKSTVSEKHIKGLEEIYRRYGKRLFV